MIHVIGLGPGNRDYILPIAIKKIEQAEIVIGAKRNLKVIEGYCSETMSLSLGFDHIAGYLKGHLDKNIAVVVSGDSGFYSMLDFVKRHIPLTSIEVIPGISSLQYMFSRLCKGHEESKWLSFHGREGDISPYLAMKKPLGILTDKKKNNQYIAKVLSEKNVMDAIIYVGERLSYEDEKISRLTVSQALTYEADSLSVVVVDYE